MAAAVLLPSCGGPACDREPALTWDNWGRGFTADFCLGCHSSLLPDDDRQDAPPGVDFNTYGDVLDQRERLQARVVDAMDMPPAGGPSAEERAMFEEWLQCAVIPDAEALGR